MSFCAWFWNWTSTFLSSTARTDSSMAMYRTARRSMCGDCWQFVIVPRQASPAWKPSADARPAVNSKSTRRMARIVFS